MSDRTSLKLILLLAANPKGTKNLRLQEEEREIKERLRLAGYGKVPINSSGATRPRDIQQAMLDWKPQVVHFSGHGAGKEGLVFEDGTGQEKLIDSEALANLFRLFTRQYPIECVVLNACYSEVQAQAIARHVDYVIGMSQAIGDRAAIEFSVGFYNALGAGESFKFAYELGCLAIQLEGISEKEYLTPILWEKGQLIDTRQNNLTPKTQILNPRRQEEGERQQPPQQPTPKIPSKSQEETDELASEKGVDYTKLRDLLPQGNWKELEPKQVAPVSTPQQVQPSLQRSGLRNGSSIPRHRLNAKSTLVVGAVVALTLVASAGALIGWQYPFLSSKPQVNLNSEVGVNYSKLQNLLSQGKWKEADEETGNVMLKVAGQEKRGWLDVRDIEKFPCTDLRTIDTLWVEYSKGRFGFSVQKRIWESVSGTPDANHEAVLREAVLRFLDRIKWRMNNAWVTNPYDSLTSDLSATAPEGLLPWLGGGWGGTYRGGLSLFSRVETCVPVKSSSVPLVNLQSR